MPDDVNREEPAPEPEKLSQTMEPGAEKPTPEQDETAGKKDETAVEKLPGKDGGIIWFVASIFIIIILPILYFSRAWRERQPVKTDKDTTIGISGSPVKTGTFKAVDGSIYTDKLLLGLIKLEESSLKLDKKQAKRVLELIDYQEGKIIKDQYYESQLKKTLTQEQITFMEKQSEGLTHEKLHENVNPEKMKNVLDQLKKIAGSETPSAMISVHPDIKPMPRPFIVSYMTLFIISFELMQKNEQLKLTPEQAGKILPFMNAYIEIKSLPQTKAGILEILTSDQKKYIDDHVRGTKEILDMPILTEKVKKLMQKKLESV